MSTTSPSAWKIETAMSVAHAVKERLLQSDPDLASDETAMRDTLDGETDVYDVLRRLARFTLEAEAMEAVTKQRATNLAARQKRFAARADAARGAIFAMMQALDVQSFPDAEFTITVKTGRSAVYVSDEASIPDEFVRTTRAVDKSAISDALKAGKDVPGASFSNGIPSLQIKAT